MITYKDFFGYEHPIICSAMTCVSDINLAIACAKAGVVPSLSTAPGRDKIPTLQSTVAAFYKEFGHCKLILGLVNPVFGTTEDFELLIIELVRKYKISHVEYIEMRYSDEFVKRLNDLGCKVIVKHAQEHLLRIKCDAVVLKGNEAAGFCSTSPLKQVFMDQIQKTNVPIIVSGGIATKEQIDFYMNNGALAVSIGTLFAASCESRIAESTKLEMIKKTSSDISYLKDSPLRGLIYRNEKDTSSHALERAVQGNFENGHIFVGTGIDYVKEILPVQEIVNRLLRR